jgi:putative molybdopterin biosynthesis protein
MLHIKLDYTFTDRPNRENQLNNSMFGLLAAIHRTGSISKAAQETGFSYRHVWGALKKWEAELGADLLVWKKGERARLTAFGEKLLFAEQRAKARVLPQLDNLVTEMEHEFALAFDENIHVISLNASHDLALNRLKGFLADEAGLYLNLHFEGSLTALSALTKGECMLAGFHVEQANKPGSSALKSFNKLLKADKHSLIRFLVRQQGLMVGAGNPRRIDGIKDLKRGDVRFVNREKGSGTRLAIEQLLSQEQIAPSLVNGFDQVETTHLAVAAAVSCGQADAGFGIQAAAAQFGLDFIPLMSEQYYFACLNDTLEQPAIRKLIATLKSDSWRAILDDLPGYDCASAGQIVTAKDFFR